MSDKEEILKLKHGEKYIVPESDYGKAEIWFINDVYILFGIPCFGGDPFFHAVYSKSKTDEMIAVYESWT
jgi:hypothetical protein